MPTLGKAKFYFRGVRWHTKNANVPVGFFLAFFYAGAHTLIICSFALMQKNQKIKAMMPSLKTDCATLKCKNSLRSNSLHFLTLRYVRFIHGFLFVFKGVHECSAFLNAHSSMPERVLQMEFLFNIM
ncbi:hypothetical protein CMT68_03255 [Elizabethkingia anophelis]|nr:hypothetical protein [Elizabethkingia anophelis]